MKITALKVVRSYERWVGTDAILVLGRH